MKELNTEQLEAIFNDLRFFQESYSNDNCEISKGFSGFYVEGSVEVCYREETLLDYRSDVFDSEALHLSHLLYSEVEVRQITDEDGNQYKIPPKMNEVLSQLICY